MKGDQWLFVTRLSLKFIKSLKTLKGVMSYIYYSDSSSEIYIKLSN